MRSLLSIFIFLVSVSLNNLYCQTETEKKLILLEYQIKELKEQNQKLTERIIALELKLKGEAPINNETSSSTPVFNNASSTQTKQLPKSATMDRCTAITQAGTQCKRSARSNGKCWQHGG